MLRCPGNQSEGQGQLLGPGQDLARGNHDGRAIAYPARKGLHSWCLSRPVDQQTFLCCFRASSGQNHPAPAPAEENEDKEPFVAMALIFPRKLCVLRPSFPETGFTSTCQQAAVLMFATLPSSIELS